MKKYISPSIEVVRIETTRMIATSGDSKEVGRSETEYTGTFNARGSRFSSWSDEEE